MGEVKLPWRGEIQMLSQLHDMRLPRRSAGDSALVEEAKRLQEEKGGFIKTMWCGELDCELKMKEQAGMSSRCMPLKQEQLGEVCACCGKPAKTMIYWGIAY